MNPRYFFIKSATLSITNNYVSNPLILVLPSLLRRLISKVIWVEMIDKTAKRRKPISRVNKPVTS